MKYRLDPTAPQGISRDDDGKIVPYFQDRVGKPSLIDSVNGKHGAVEIVGGTNVTVDNSGKEIKISASGGGGGGSVDSVNGQTGTVVLDADDIDDTSTSHKFVTASDLTTLSNTSGTNTGDQDLSGYLLSATAASTYEPIKGSDDNYVTDAEKVIIGNTSGTNTGDQDLSSLALKSNVLELDNTGAFTPNADYEPATKKYVDDSITSGGGYTDEQAQDAVGTILTDSTEIDFTYTDATPSITASIKSASIDETKLDTSVNASLDLADSATQPGDLATVATTGSYSDLSGTPTIPTISDTAYNATSWNGNSDGATKNAIRDKISTMDAAISLNTAKTTNATHTGEVTGSGALTIADNIVDEANLKVDNSPTDDYVLTAKSSAAGGLTWKAVSGGGGSGMTWSEVTTTSQSAAVNSGYITNNAGLVTVTLPTTAAVGDVVRIAGKGAGGWKLAQNASETVHFGSSDTTTGTGGSLASVNRYDTVELVCITANSDWVVISSVGNLTVV